MTMRGTIERGRLVLDDGTRLPDGTRVSVRVARGNARKAGGSRSVRGKRTSGGEGATIDPVYRLFELAVEDRGPPDLALEHDHYLYGTPKKYAARRGQRGRRAASGVPSGRTRRRRT